MKSQISSIIAITALSAASISSHGQGTAGVTQSNDYAGPALQTQSQAEPPSQSATLIRTESSGAMSGFDNAYKISGAWNISSINEKVKELDADSNTNSSRSDFVFNYFRQIGNDVWIGPYIAYALTRSNTDGESSSTREWRPGVEFRKVFTTKGNGYIATSLQAGWAFAGQAIDSTDGEITSSMNGFNYGLGLSLGNRVGEDDAYIVETGISYTRASLTGDISLGSNSVDLSTSVGRFAFSISIGKLF